jgi:hypothetical protein
MDPERLPRPKPPVTGTAPLPRTLSCGELAAWGAMARRGRCAGRGRPHGIRTEIGLAPEDRDRWQRAGRRPCASTCRLQEQPANGRSRRNTRPSAGLQNDFSSDERESACKPAVFLEAADNRRTASPESVRPDAEEQVDCRNEKDLQMQAFSKRLMGFEPTTFCMASRAYVSRSAPTSPANAWVLGCRCRFVIPRLSPRVHWGLGTEWAPSRGRGCCSSTRRLK